MLENYFKVAWRGLRRRKFFTFISLFGISFTLVVLTLFVAIADHTLGPLEPEVKRDRTLVLNRVLLLGRTSFRNTTAGYLLLDRYLRDLPGVEAMSVVSDSPARVTTFTGGGKVRLQMRRTDGAFWDVMGFRFLEGGPYGEAEDLGGRPVAVVSESTRRKVFGKGEAVGQELRIDGQVYQVVGVVEDVPFYRFLPFGEVWVPIGASLSNEYRLQLAGGFTGLFVMERGADAAAIQREARDRLDRIEFPDSEFDRIEADLVTPVASLASQLGVDAPGLYAGILTLALLFMLLPAINLVNLNLSRIMERSSEVGVRKAFGARQADLVGQFVFENVLLSLVGGALSIVISLFLLDAVESSGIVPYAAFRLSWRIFASALGLTIVFGLVSGAYPAWRISRLNPVEALRGGSR